jgi:sodium/hydrogen antiporter
MEWALAVIALALLGVAAVSGKLSGSPVTPAMLFVGIGLLVGPQALGTVDLEATSSTVRTLAEATLGLVLFCDASRIDLAHLRRQAAVPARLLGIGLPLTIVAGGLAAAAIFNQMTIGEAVILGIILAPTDAALGQAVVTEPRLPGRIRQGLNIESGLNDGICVPLLFAGVAAADVESHISEGRDAVTLLLEEIGYGVVGGAAAGLLTAAVVVYAGRRDLIGEPWKQVIPAAGAALAYGIASGLGGSGFIAAFVAGIVFRAGLRRDPEGLNQLSEAVADVLNGITFLLFGAVLLGPALGELSWKLALYALMSLTIVRMVPVALAMWGSGARRPTLAFLGWFGPRGLASIVFALIVVEESQLPHEHTILLAIYITVGLSVLAHGLTAAPLAHRYARWFEAHPRDGAPPMEAGAVEATRPRGPRASATLRQNRGPPGRKRLTRTKNGAQEQSWRE